MSALPPWQNLATLDDPTALFERIAVDIEQRGFSIKPFALPAALIAALQQLLSRSSLERFDRAGIGRDRDYMLYSFVRSDEICWIDNGSTAGTLWLSWIEQLKQFLNHRLLLGLFSFESHFAHYAPGDFYKRHLDAFNGNTNRVLSLVVYLNPSWSSVDGGELVLYRNDHDHDHEGIRVTPANGTVVAFLSEDFPHEVLPAQRDRFSIAGWFSVNRSTGYRPDPPT
jgi:SM-20-related protein